MTRVRIDFSEPPTGVLLRKTPGMHGIRIDFSEPPTGVLQGKTLEVEISNKVRCMNSQADIVEAHRGNGCAQGGC